jgi:hypothetical protein
MRATGSRWIAVVSLLVGLIAALGSTAAAAQATTTISGLVLSLDDVPLAGVRLAAYTQPNTVPDRQPVATTQTDATGRYTMQVPAGQIWIGVLTQDIVGQSIWGYDNTPLNITAGVPLTAADFRVAIRVLPTPAPPTPLPPAPPPVEPPGMPTTGAAPGAPWAALALGGALLLGGLALRRSRRVARARQR